MWDLQYSFNVNWTNRYNPAIALVYYSFLSSFLSLCLSFLGNYTRSFIISSSLLEQHIYLFPIYI